MASRRITEGFTESDENEFRHLNSREKIDCMELYLIGDGRSTYNQVDVAEKYYRDRDFSFRVSLIHRGYNFSGQNSGRYRSGCKFEKTNNYHVTRKDIEDFVRTYPNGTYRKYVTGQNGTRRLYTFEDFLLERLHQPSKKYTSSETPRQRQPRSSTPVNDSVWEPEPRSRKTVQNHKGDEESTAVALFGFGVICAIILIVMFFRGAVFKHLLISGFLLLTAIGGICGAIGELNE